jgi:DNA polymerase-3 subunit delta
LVQIKPADADRFLAKPDPAIRVILIYGDDDGLVAERVANFVRAVTGKSDDPFAVVRLESSEVADDPARLADEAHAVPLFGGGGGRVIIVRLAGPRPIITAVEAILAAPPVDSWVVIAAGEQRKTSALRKLCESHKGAAAIACYADSARDLDRIIDEETRAAALMITPEARAALRELLGADRMVSRAEVTKLCLYAAGEAAISLDHIRAVIGDAAAFATEEVANAAAAGDAAALDRAYRRLLAAGTSASSIVGAVVRHFNSLQKARAAVEAGASTESVAQRAGFFYARRDAFVRALDGWKPAAIDAALSRLDQALFDSRLHRGIENEVVGQALQSVAYMAGGRR